MNKMNTPDSKMIAAENGWLVGPDPPFNVTLWLDGVPVTVIGIAHYGIGLGRHQIADVTISAVLSAQCLRSADLVPLWQELSSPWSALFLVLCDAIEKGFERGEGR